MSARKSGLFKFRVEEDLAAAVEAAARELRISPSEAGRVALRLWLEELDRVPHPDRLPSRLVAPAIEIGKQARLSPVESDADRALRRLHEHMAARDAEAG